MKYEKCKFEVRWDNDWGNSGYTESDLSLIKLNLLSHIELYRAIRHPYIR